MRTAGAAGEELLAVAVEAARMAGGLLLERAQGGAEREVESKSTPTDLVSEADLASERAIRALLSDRRPEDGYQGEEGGSAEGASGLSWVVDPLDGTINFLFGIPQWCVSVAVRDAEVGGQRIGQGMGRTQHAVLNGGPSPGGAQQHPASRFEVGG